MVNTVKLEDPVSCEIRLNVSLILVITVKYIRAPYNLDNAWLLIYPSTQSVWISVFERVNNQFLRDFIICLRITELDNRYDYDYEFLKFCFVD